MEPGIPCRQCNSCKTGMEGNIGVRGGYNPAFLLCFSFPFLIVCIGRYNLCPDIIFMATPPFDGYVPLLFSPLVCPSLFSSVPSSNVILGLCQTTSCTLLTSASSINPFPPTNSFSSFSFIFLFFLYINLLSSSSSFFYRLPDHVSYDEGAMCEPLSVGVHAVTRAKVSVGQTVLITGAGKSLLFSSLPLLSHSHPSCKGPIGLMCLMAARAAGAGITIITGTPSFLLPFGHNCYSYSF